MFSLVRKFVFYILKNKKSIDQDLENIVVYLSDEMHPETLSIHFGFGNECSKSTRTTAIRVTRNGTGHSCCPRGRRLLRRTDTRIVRTDNTCCRTRLISRSDIGFDVVTRV